MKRLVLIVAACVLSAATTLFGQTHTQNISFDDRIRVGNAGNYGASDSFSFVVYLTLNG